MNIAEQKRRLRLEAERARAALSQEYIVSAGADIASRVMATPAYLSAETMFCYVSMTGEPDTRLMISRAINGGKRVCAPLCLGRGVMEARLVRDFSELVPGVLGILQPRFDAPELRSGDIDLAVIPCASCAYDGRRLGRGGGYYDRFLAEYEGCSIALCFDALVRGDIPTEAHDRAVKFVATESGVYKGLV